MKFGAAILVTGSAGLLAGPALAGPLDLGHVPPDAKMVGHVDLEAMRQSEVGGALVDGPKVGPLLMFDRLRRDVGVDAMRDCLDVTLYSSSACMAHTVALMTCSGDGARAFLEKMAKAGLPDFEHGGEPGLEYWSWRRREARTFAAVHVASRDDERVILFADSVEGLRGAIARLNGPARESGENVARPQPGSCLFVWIQEFGACDSWQPQAQVLRHTSSVLVDIGFKPDQTPPAAYGNARVIADSEASAELIQQVMTGTLAMYRLSVLDTPGSAAMTGLLEQVRSEVNGKELRVEWGARPGELLGAMRAIGKPGETATQPPGGTLNAGETP